MAFNLNSILREITKLCFVKHFKLGEEMNPLVRREGGKNGASPAKSVVQGEEKVKSGPTNPACCYCLFGQKTSVIARDEGRCSCEACGQRAGRPAELPGSSSPHSANTGR